MQDDLKAARETKMELAAFKDGLHALLEGDQPQSDDDNKDFDEPPLKR